MLNRVGLKKLLRLSVMVLGSLTPATLFGQVRNASQPAAERVAAGGNQATFSASNWCADTGTACWAGGDKRGYLNGLRILADLDLSFAYQGGDNKFENTLRGMPKVAIETNLRGGWVALQAGLIPPGTVQFDDRSPAVESLRDELRQERRVHFTSGVLAGLSFLDGALVAGWGMLRYDRRDFVTTTPLAASVFRDSFYYVALQPIASIRSSFKRNKDGGGATAPAPTPSGTTPP